MRSGPRIRLGFLLRLAAADWRVDPWSHGAAAAILTGVTAAALVAPDLPGLEVVAALAMFLVPAAVGSATAPRRREDAAVLVTQGSPRWCVTVPAWLSATAVAAVATIVVGVVSLAVAPNWPPVWILVIGALGAAATASDRLPERPAIDRPVRAARLVLAVCLFAIGCLGAGGVSTGSGADLAVPVAFAAVAVACLLFAPFLPTAASAVARRSPSSAGRLAAAGLTEHRRGLAVPAALIGFAALFAAAQLVAGAGLQLREERRVAAVEALGPATTTPSARVLVLTPDPAHLEEAASGAPDAWEVGPRIRVVAPGALVVPLDLTMFEATPADPALGHTTTDVGAENENAAAALFGIQDGRATATRDVLTALGIDPRLATGDRIVVLDRRYLRADGTVELEGRRFPAVAPFPRQVSLQPGLLVPAAMGPAVDAGLDGVSDRRGAIRLWLVRLTAAPTPRTIEAIERAAGGVALPQDRGVPGVRSDGVEALGVRTPDDARRLVRTTGIVVGAILLIAQLASVAAQRRDDEVLATLGQSRRRSAVVGAVRAAVLTATSTVVGLAAGVAAAATAMSLYNTWGRFRDGAPMAALPLTLPGELWWITLGFPVAGAVIGGGVTALAVGGADRRTRLAW